MRNKWDITQIDSNGEFYTSKKIYSPVRKKALKMLIIAMILYTAFLVLGFANTRFYRDNKGAKVPFFISFGDLRKQEDYFALRSSVTLYRELLCESTVIDIHLANGKYTASEADACYKKLLNGKLDKGLPAIKAMELTGNREAIKEKVVYMINTKYSAYLQHMSTGLIENNQTAITEAMKEREASLEMYKAVLSDLKIMADSLKIQDKEFFDWELGEAVLLKDGTAILERKG